MLEDEEKRGLGGKEWKEAGEILFLGKILLSRIILDVAFTDAY